MKSPSFDLVLYGQNPDQQDSWNPYVVYLDFHAAMDSQGNYIYKSDGQGLSEDKIKDDLWTAFKSIRNTYLIKGGAYSATKPTSTL